MCVGVIANAKHTVSTAAPSLLDFCRSPSGDGHYGYFLSCYLCWEFERALFLEFVIACWSAGSFSGSDYLLFPFFPLCLLCTLSMQQMLGWGKKKGKSRVWGTRSFPCMLVPHSWARNLQGTLSVTCWESLNSNGRIKESKGALLDMGMVSWDSWSGTESVLSAAVFPLDHSNALHLGQELFGMFRGFSSYSEQYFLWAGFWKCRIWIISNWIKNHSVTLNPTKEI